MTRSKISIAQTTTAALIAVVASIGAAGRPSVNEACCAFKSNQHPSWTIVLQAAAPEPYGKCDWYPESQAQVEFVGATTVVAAIHQDCFLKKGAIPPVAAHTVDTLFSLDARTGAIIKQISWKDISTESSLGVSLLRLSGDRFIFHSGTTLKLCHSDLSELRSRTLETFNPRTERWAVRVSANGEHLLLRHWNADKHTDLWSEDHWISPETLEDVSYIRTVPYDSEFAISNDRVFYNPRTQGLTPGNEDTVYVRRIGERDGRPLCAGCTGVVVAVTDQGTVVLYHANHAELWLVTSDGTVSLSKRFGIAQDRVDHAEVAPQGDEFAFSFGHARYSILGDRGFVTFVVFDAEKKEQRFRMFTATYPQKEGNGVEFLATPFFTLSPALNRLLVSDGFILKCFPLMPEKMH